MNQNKGIGQYKDRPGYFWGGLVGGAILGALVNKMQGKDWKKGAMWGGITGGLGSAMVGPGAAGSTGWLSKMNPGMTKSLLTMGSGNPALFGSLAGAGGAWMAGDSEYDEEKWRQKKREEEEKRREEQKKAYRYWHTNPFARGGIATARPGYPGGGSATLEYTDPDLYTPTGEGRGPSSSPILQIPLGPEGSFADEFEDLDLSSGPGAGDMSGWYEMYDDLKSKGELPDWMDSFDLFMQNLDVLDISPTDFSAQGGYKTRPKYQYAGAVNKGSSDLGEKGRRSFQELYEQWMGPDTITRAQQAAEEEEDPYAGAVNKGSSDERSSWKELYEQWIGGDTITRSQQAAEEEEEFMRKYSPMNRAKGGIADLDMTKGGASTGPGTGTSDDIPAMLSDGEFVVTANAVKNLGGGDRMLGAKRMYSMMNQLDPSSQTPAEMSAVGIT